MSVLRRFECGRNGMPKEIKVKMKKPLTDSGISWNMIHQKKTFERINNFSRSKEGTGFDNGKGTNYERLKIIVRVKN